MRAVQVGAALGLHFFAVAAIVLCRTFIDILFLTTYPAAWLPYLFLGQTGVTLLLTFSVKPLIARGSTATNVGMMGLLGLGMIAFPWLMTLQIPGISFGVCLWLAAQSVLLGVVSWSAVGDAFDVRQFKRLAKWINAAGSVGALVLGALIPLLIRLLVDSALLYLLGGMLLGAAVCLGVLRPLEARPRRSAGADPRSPLGYALFRQLALGACLLMLVDTFADYALKLELARAYSRAEIGTFMGPFYGVASLLTLALQFGASETLLGSFGVAGLLSPLPVFGVAAGLVMALRPGFWPAAILRMGENVARYSLDNLGREIAARPLPASIRRAGKLYLKGLATPLGTGLGAVFLWLFAARVGLGGVGLALLATSLIWFFISVRTTGAYQKTLEQAVGVGRLSVVVEEVSAATLLEGRSVARHALASADPEVVLFGLQLLEQVGSGELPPAVREQLGSPSAEIRAAAVRAAGAFNRGTAAPALLRRLELERDPLVTWRLLEAVAVTCPDAALEQARPLVASEHPDVKAGAVLVLLAGGDLDGLIAAATTLKDMIHSDVAGLRRGAARAIGALTAGKLERELERLVADTDPEVCAAAIQAAGARQATGLVDQLSRLLGSGRISYHAGRALLALGPAVIPALLEVIRTGETAASRTAIRVLARIPGERPEAEMATLVATGQIGAAARTTLAREAARRARRHPVSEAFVQRVRAFVDQEAAAVRGLRGAARGGEHPAELVVELEGRERLALRRLLYWLAICTRPGEVLDLIPTVLSGPGGPAASRRAAAVELLDSMASKPLRRSLSVFEDKPAPPVPLEALEDRWILWLVDQERRREGGAAMDIAQRVMLLRKVDLFHTLPGETLLTIAEICEQREFAAQEKIFAQDDPPDGLYVVAAGTVEIRSGDETWGKLAKTEFFGEVALLDDEPRMADAVASSDGMALFIDREVFRQITEDLPEVLRAMIRTLIQYLKHAETTAGQQTMF